MGQYTQQKNTVRIVNDVNLDVNVINVLQIKIHIFGDLSIIVKIMSIVS